jgi:hypothetical protein
VVSNLTIVGVERTQSVQYFDFNRQGSGAGEDNSIPLIEGKALVLRVYVNTSSLPGIPIPRRISGSVSYGSNPDLAPFNGPITPQPASSIDRGNIDHTLNFLVPGFHCVGTVSFRVTVFDPDHRGQRAYTSRPFRFDVTFEFVPKPRIHLILVRYTGQGLDIPSPPGSIFVEKLELVARVYPIRYFYYAACQELPFSGDLSAPLWPELTMWLGMVQSLNQTRDIFVAMLPVGTPHGNTYGVGTYGGNAAIMASVGQLSLAHEIGHVLNRDHAPCGNPDNVDRLFPRYNNYPSGSIGEYAVDMATYGFVFSPALATDFMGYCADRWVSPYTYLALKDQIVRNDGAIRYATSVEVPDQQSLLLRFRVYFDGRVTVEPGYVVTNVRLNQEAPLATLYCELLDKQR